MYKFPLLASIIRDFQENPFDEELCEYSDHLNNLIADMKRRFTDFISFFPFCMLAPSHLMIIIRRRLSKRKIMVNSKLYLRNHSSQPGCSKLKKDILKFYLLPFTTSFLVETAFSHVFSLLSKERNRLDIVSRGDLRIKLTSISPRISQLAKKFKVKFLIKKLFLRFVQIFIWGLDIYGEE